MLIVILLNIFKKLLMIEMLMLDNGSIKLVQLLDGSKLLMLKILSDHYLLIWNILKINVKLYSENNMFLMFLKLISLWDLPN